MSSISKNGTKKRTIATTLLCFSILMCCIGGGLLRNRHKNVIKDTVNIVELETIDALRAVPESEFIAAENTLYKVANDYYSYFPSTGKLELVSSVHDYDTMSLTLIEGMLNDIQATSAGDTQIISIGVDKVEQVNGAIAERVQYVQREIDNCNANLLLVSNDTNLLTYKTKLESELMQLASYQVTATESLNTFLAFLGTDETDKVLAEKISQMIDTSFVQIINNYNNAAETERMLNVQNDAIQLLTEKYNDIEKILTEKYVTIGSSSNTEIVQTLLQQLDTYVVNYVSEYNVQLSELTAKMTVLEKLYMSIGTNVNNEAGVDITTLQTIREQYNSLKEEQSNLQSRLMYLEKLLADNNVNKEMYDISSNDNVTGLLQKELEDLNAQYKAITDILENAGLDNLEKITEEQERLLETIKSIEEVQKAADTLLSDEQLKALSETKDSLQTILSDSSTGITEDTEIKLKELASVISENLSELDTDTHILVTELMNALDNTAVNQDNIYDELYVLLANLTEKLNEDITEQNVLREELDNSIQIIISQMTVEQDVLRQKLEDDIQNGINETNTDIKEKYDSTQDVLSALSEKIKTIEEVQKAADKLLSEEQNKALNTVKESLQTILSESSTVITEATETKLWELVSVISVNLTKLGADMQTEEEEFKLALENTTDNQKRIYEELYMLLENLITKLNEAITAQNVLRETYDNNVQSTIAQMTNEQDLLRQELEDDLQSGVSETNAQIQEKYDITQDVLNTLKETSDTDISNLKGDLQDAFDKLLDSYNKEFMRLKEDTYTVLNEVTDNLGVQYLEVAAKINNINVQVNGLLTIYKDHGNRLDSMENTLIFVDNHNSSFDTTISKMCDDIDLLTLRVKELETNKYVLPVATLSTLGGVKVDGTTITVGSDGTLRSLVTYENLDQFYPVGSTYTDLTGPKKRIEPYCIQLAEVHVTELTANTSKEQSARMQIGTKAIPAETVTTTVGQRQGKVYYVTIRYKSDSLAGHSNTTQEHGPFTESEYQVFYSQYPKSGYFGGDPNVGTWSETVESSRWENSGTYVYYHYAQSSDGRTYTSGIYEYAISPISYTFPATTVPEYGYRWRYRATDPFTSSVYVSEYIYETEDDTPDAHTFYGSRYDICYIGDNRLDSKQLQKLKNAGIISNVTDEQIHLRELYTKYGSGVYIYCGTGSTKAS